jgi:hypothetical protein
MASSFISPACWRTGPAKLNPNPRKTASAEKPGGFFLA